MRKYTLDIEELTVESFATDTALGAMGTVRAHAFVDAADDGDIITAPPPPPPPSVNCSANPYTGVSVLRAVVRGHLQPADVRLLPRHHVPRQLRLMHG